MRLRSKIIVYIFLTFTVLFLCILGFGQKTRIYETTIIEDYGRYIGNYDNDTPHSFITSFFPAEIDDSFSDVEYSYKAKKLDSYSYEAYLEFSIPDSELFYAYAEDLIETHGNPAIFAYDNTFEEFNISNVYGIASNAEVTGNSAEKVTENSTYRILEAQIGKILISRASQRIIYVAIGLYDGGGTNTSELCYFFNKFDIDPCEYANSAYVTAYEQQKESKK